MTANKPVDGARIRAILFDPNVPDYAFLTQEEVFAAFGASESTFDVGRSRAAFLIQLATLG